MGNKPLTKLRQADLEYFHHMTTFTDAEIGKLNRFSLDHLLVFLP